MTERPFPIDFATLITGSKPNDCLALPPGFDVASKPDLESPVFAASPDAVLAAFKEAGLAAPRTELVREEAGQIELVQRSAIFKFPDYITATAVAVEGGAALCVYSRAVVGYSDMGVNAKRVKVWLEATAARL